VIHYDNSRSTHGMNQPKISILGLSSCQRSVTRFALQPTVRRSLGAAKRRQVTATFARIWHFLLDTNRRSIGPSRTAQLTENKGRTYFLLDTNGAFLLRTNGRRWVAPMSSSHSTLATSHCLFHETPNCRFSRCFGHANRRPNAMVRRSPLAFHQTPLTIHQSRFCPPEPRP
jgi:hypothetical protein